MASADLTPSSLTATRYETRGRVAVIFLHRPHRNNAWTGTMDREYRWCLDRAEHDERVGAIVITGTGTRFCVGGDSQALAGHAERGGYDTGLSGTEATPGYGVDRSFDHPLAYHYGLSKPVIAAVNGAAAGIGMALACYADLRVAEATTKFTTAHGKLGLPAEYGLSWMLPRMIGLTRAMDILLSSRVVLGDEAHAIGLVNQLHPADELLDAAVDYADTLVRTVAASSLRETRRQTYQDLHGSIGNSVATSMRLLDEMMQGDEYREGVNALLEKRPPRF